MNLLRLISVLCVICFSGCESMPDRFAAVPPQRHVFEGTPEQVYTAAKLAFKRLDFVLTRSVIGQVEAVSAIHTSETFGDSRQTVVRININGTEDGKSEVEMWVSDEVSSSSMGGTRRTGLREHGLYSLYYATLQQILNEKALEKPVENN